MKRQVMFAALALLALVGGMVWLLSGTSKVGGTESVAQATNASQAHQSSTVQASASAAGQPASAPSQDPALDTAAVLSLREGRVNGDSRAPPMSDSADRLDQPTQNQLDDPAAYAQYEHGEQLKVFQSYVNAVPQKVQTLQDALDQADQPGSGVSQAQRAAARHKIALLKAMQAKLLNENPELAAPAGKAVTTSSSAAPAAPASTSP